MHERRNTANIFMADINPFCGRNQFGGMKDRDLVDALILEHEADRLGLPSGPDVGSGLPEDDHRRPDDQRYFRLAPGRLNNRVSGEQLLTLIGDQVRLQKVRFLPGSPLVTPYDVFRTYRDQNEHVSAKAVEIPVEKFLAKVPEPSRTKSRPCTRNTRTSCPTRPARLRVSRSPGRSRSRSSRSTATLWRGGSWTSSPRQSSDRL